MIGVSVTGGDDIYEVELSGSDYPLGHSNMGLLCERIFSCERVGKVGIKKKVLAVPLQQKSTLAQPPKMELILLAA